MTDKFLSRLNAKNSGERRHTRCAARTIIGLVPRSSLSEKNKQTHDEISKQKEIERINEIYDRRYNILKDEKYKLNHDMISQVIAINGGIELFTGNGYVSNKCINEILSIKEDKNNLFNRAITALDSQMFENEQDCLHTIQITKNKNYNTSELNIRRASLGLNENGVPYKSRL